jgi:hypothetical protein
MNIIRLPCGCIVERWSQSVERIHRICDCCAAELLNDRPKASTTERAITRKELQEVA